MDTYVIALYQVKSTELCMLCKDLSGISLCPLLLLQECDEQPCMSHTLSLGIIHLRGVSLTNVVH